MLNKEHNMPLGRTGKIKTGRSSWRCAYLMSRNWVRPPSWARTCRSCPSGTPTCCGRSAPARLPSSRCASPPAAAQRLVTSRLQCPWIAARVELCRAEFDAFCRSFAGDFVPGPRRDRLRWALETAITRLPPEPARTAPHHDSVGCP